MKPTLTFFPPHLNTLSLELMPVSLRPATPEDEAFLLSVYATTRAAELELVPWSEEQKAGFVRMQFVAQHDYYHERYPNADYQVILRDGEGVGRLYVRREAQSIRIMDITVLPQHRNNGIGSSLVKELLKEAKREGKSVEIYVESFNTSLRLFERLGFMRKAEEGINYLLEWRAR